MKNAQRLVSLLIVNGAVLGVGLVFLELLFGAWLGDARRLNRLNLVRDRVIHHDISDLYESPAPVIRYSRDRYGLRGAAGDPSEVDLLTVGGSTTDQRFIDDSATWQSVLQRRLASEGDSIVVANAGVDGQSTIGHIRSFQWWFPNVPGLEPEYVLFYVGINDLHVDDGAVHDDLVKDSGGVRFRERSAVWHLVRTARGIHRAKTRRIGHDRAVEFDRLEWTRKPLHTEYDFMRSRLDAYAERLRILMARTREMGAKPICVTQPSRFHRFRGDTLEGVAELWTYDDRDHNGVDLYRMMRHIDGVTTRVCREADAVVFDLAVAADWEDDDFYDFVHMTPQGTAKVGRLLFERLRSWPW